MKSEMFFIFSELKSIKSTFEKTLGYPDSCLLQLITEL